MAILNSYTRVPESSPPHEIEDIEPLIVLAASDVEIDSPLFQLERDDLGGLWLIPTERFNEDSRIYLTTKSR